MFDGKNADYTVFVCLKVFFKIVELLLIFSSGTSSMSLKQPPIELKGSLISKGILKLE